MNCRRNDGARSGRVLLYSHAICGSIYFQGEQARGAASIPDDPYLSVLLVSKRRSQVLICRVVSMGRRNTQLARTLH